MRTKLVVGNWKMNLNQAEAKALVEAFLAASDPNGDAEVGFCPQYTAIHAVREAVAGTKVKVGAQNVFWAPKGAFTGFVSASALADAGVELVIIGHSETRGRFGKLETPESTIPFFAETDETVNLKIRAAIGSNLKPIVCVGETKGEREAGATDATIQAQVEGALAGFTADELADLVVAYEPVWAIGTGLTCDTPEAERVCAMVRATIAQVLGQAFADGVRILYGGSVKASNAVELFGQPNIDGGLVGGASLDAKEFAAVVAAA